MGKRDYEDDVQDTVEEAPKSAPDLGRYPGDIVKDKKSGRKGKFINEYGTNGRAVIVIPDGQTRSELWDAAQIEVIKRVKRPTQNIPASHSVPAGMDGDDEEIDSEVESDDDDEAVEEA